jgi:hypothetical protein
VSIFTDLLGGAGSTVRQLFTWQVVGQVLQAALGPYFRKITQLVNRNDPNAVLTPPDLASAVVRQVLTQTMGQTEATASGLDNARFQTLIDLAGEPPGLETILELFRRGVIQWGKAGPTLPTVANAIATSRIYPYWADAIRALNIVPIPAAEMVDARVENQVTVGTRDAIESAAGGGTSPPGVSAATTFYEVMWANGFTPAQADVMFNTRGNPPPPSELFSLYRRGIIPLTGTGPTALTVQQGIFEGATKDKWFTPLTALITAIPSEYYIVLMLKTGQITPTLAAKLLAETGYTQTVINGIIGAASSQSVTTSKKLTESVIVKLYQDRAITRTEAKSLLIELKYGATAATFVLLAADLTLHAKAVSSAISKIGTRYQAKKLSTSEAQAALAALTVPASQVTALLQTWTLTRSTNLELLTESTVVDAWHYGVISADAALAYLVNLGYTPYDAWVLLSVKNEAALGTPPAITGTSYVWSSPNP